MKIKKIFEMSFCDMKTKPSDYLPGRYEQLTIDSLIKEKEKEKESTNDESGN